MRLRDGLLRLRDLPPLVDEVRGRHPITQNNSSHHHQAPSPPTFCPHPQHSTPRAPRHPGVFSRDPAANNALGAPSYPVHPSHRANRRPHPVRGEPGQSLSAARVEPHSHQQPSVPGSPSPQALPALPATLAVPALIALQSMPASPSPAPVSPDPTGPTPTLVTSHSPPPTNHVPPPPSSRRPRPGPSAMINPSATCHPVHARIPSAPPPPLLSFRAQRSGAEESRIPSMPHPQPRRTAKNWTHRPPMWTHSPKN